MSEPRRFRVLFVCIGNSCRSPMAEGLANSKHGDVIEATSAGVGPAPIVQPETIEALAERGVSIEGKRPQSLKNSDWANADLVINMSGTGILGQMPGLRGGNLIWEVTDPIGRSFATYRKSRDRIEQLVDQLADMLRKHAKGGGADEAAKR